jgi:hypothetical protein
MKPSTGAAVRLLSRDNLDENAYHLDCRAAAFTGMLSAIDRNHCPPSNGMPVRHHRNTQCVSTAIGKFPERVSPLPVLQ